MNIPLASISNDWHIKEDNTEQLINLVIEQCELNKNLGIKYIICIGDIFNSRKSQSLLVLNTFGRILDIVQEYGFELWAIPGNHDKTSYTSDESFLDQFKHHPNFRLIHLSGGLPFKKHNIFLHFLPFWSNEIWLERFDLLLDYIGDFEKGEKHILCSHIAVEGSINNDGSKVNSSIKPSMFKKFYKVFLGHYHNQQKISSNIYHLPSIQQNNFGEDSEKGFTVIYSDGSHKLFESNFKTFKKIKLNVDKLSKDNIREYIKEYETQTNDSNIRFILEGSEEKLKSLNKEQFLQAGIEIQTKNNEIGIIEDFDTVEITKYTDENIIDEFKEFCEEKGLDFKHGVKYLK